MTAPEWTNTLIAIATVVQAIVSIIMMNGLRHAARQTRIAREAFKLAEKTTQRQLRAYVDISRTRFSKRTVGEPVELRLQIKNMGQTPALNVVTDWRLAICSHEIMASPDRPERDANASGFSLGAGQSFNISDHVPASEWEPCLEDLKADRSVIVVVGWVTYEDIFGEQRRTDFTRYVAHAELVDYLQVAGANMAT